MTEQAVTIFPAYPRWGDAAGEQLLDHSAHGRIRAWLKALAKQGLRIELNRESTRTVLHLEGKLDHQSAPVLKRGFKAIIPFATTFIDVDLQGVDRIDGMGLGALVWAWRVLQEEGGELRLVRLRPSVREIVAKMNLHHLLEIVEDREGLLLSE